VKAQTSCIIEAQPAYRIDASQFWFVNQLAPVVLLVWFPRRLSLRLGTIIVDDNGLVETHSVAELSTPACLLDKPEQLLASVVQYPILLDRQTPKVWQ
jgi:hypothetical protein